MAGYFAYVDADPELARAYLEIRRLLANYRGKERFAEAELVRKAAFDMRAAYEKLGTEGALKADMMIREILRETQKRAERSGKLSKAIKSRPQVTALPAGAVAIASIDALDEGTVNKDTGGIYWRAQEYGLPATPEYLPRTKRHAVYGYFRDPGVAAPSEDQFREHAYFRQETYQKGVPSMVRRRALEPRRFLTRGSAAFVAWHQEQATRINDALIAEIARIPR